MLHCAACSSGSGGVDGGSGGVSELRDKLHNVDLNSSSNDNSSEDSGDSESHATRQRAVNGRPEAGDGGKPQAKLIVSGAGIIITKKVQNFLLVLCMSTSQPLSLVLTFAFQRQSTASLLYCRREPDMEDRLSSADIEKVLQEVHTYNNYVHCTCTCACVAPATTRRTIATS